MTRTIRMSLAGNAVTGVDISPPFDDKPDRVPLTEQRQAGRRRSGRRVRHSRPRRGSAGRPGLVRSHDSGVRRLHALRRRSDLRRRSATSRPRATAGPVAICAVRYVPIAGHRRDRPATKFMAENKDIEVWLAPVGQRAGADAVPRLGPHHDRHRRDRGVGVQRRRPNDGAAPARAVERQLSSSGAGAASASRRRPPRASASTSAPVAWPRIARSGVSPAWIARATSANFAADVVGVGFDLATQRAHRVAQCALPFVEQRDRGRRFAQALLRRCRPRRRTAGAMIALATRVRAAFRAGDQAAPGLARRRRRRRETSSRIRGP